MLHNNNTKNYKLLELYQHYQQKVVQDKCVLMERTLFSAVPESQARIQQDAPSYLNASHFETLQWLHRTSHYHAGVNGFPKSMILVSSESRRPSLRFTGRVHRILHSCNKNNPGYVPIRIRHYVGSWEVYTSRLDTRVGPIRNLQVYSYRAQLGRNQVDDAVRGWIRGFARLMQDNATRIQHLLQGTGQVQVSSALQTKIQQTNWSLTCRQIQSQIQKNSKKDPHYVQWLNQQYPELVSPGRK